MPSIAPPPALLLIHGAWHHPEFYAPLCKSLEALNYEVVCPRLPSCNDAVPPTKSLHDDVALIRATAQTLLNGGKRVVAIMHSYGGMVGTEALHGLPIEHLVYMTAFLPSSGKGLAGMFGGMLPPFIEIDEENAVLRVPGSAPVFYNDLAPADAAHWEGKLVVHPKSAQFDPISHEAYRDIPATYILCEKDAALLPMLQEMMISNARNSGVEIAIERLAGGHSPFLSVPDKTAELVHKIVSK